MSDTVLVRHPAWITHRKPRGRVVWDSQVRHETRATLRSRDPRDFQKILDFPSGHTFQRGRKLYADGNGFWELLLTRLGKPVQGNEFRAYLQDDEIPDALTLVLGQYFSGTPVASHGGGGEWVDGAYRARAFRGLPEDPDRLGEVYEDGRPMAGADLQGFLDENVALVAEGVAMRCRPVARSSGTSVGNGRLWHLSTRRNYHAWGEIAASPQVLDALTRIRPGMIPEQSVIIEAWRQACATIPDPDADLVYMLNAHAMPVRTRLSNRLAKGDLPDVEAETVNAILESFTPIARAAMVGSAGTRDLAGDLAAFARAAACAALYPARSADGSEPSDLSDFVQDHVQPRLRAMLDAAMPREDLEAFQGLAP